MVTMVTVPMRYLGFDFDCRTFEFGFDIFVVGLFEYWYILIFNILICFYLFIMYSMLIGIDSKWVVNEF
jgi:hypothetical protein